jgi:hypothetical protein
MHTKNQRHSISLFISKDDPISEEVAESLLAWGKGRADCAIEVIPVLSQPEEVVRLQIFYTPALVMDGQLIAGGINSTEDLARFLPDELDVC